MPHIGAKGTSAARGFLRSRKGVGLLFRHANRRQRAVVVVCGLVVLHGLFTLFVPGVEPEDTTLACPPAVAAAVVGSTSAHVGGVSPEAAAEHDAVCAATGRWWLAAGLLQIGVAAGAGWATLVWARWRRRSRRRKHRPEEDQAPEQE